MMLAEYLVMFVFVAIMGFGLPGPGQASLIAAGALAGEGHLNVAVIGALALAALVVGSYVGYRIGAWKGRRLLDRPGRPLEKTRRKLLDKGDKAFGHGGVTFFASATMPSFLPGIFHVRLYTFMLVTTGASICWTIMYVGLSYWFGAEIARHIASKGTNAILGVVVLVVVGLAVRFGWSWWRARRREDQTAAPQDQAAVVPGDDTSPLGRAGPVRAGRVFLERNEVLGPGRQHGGEDPPGFLGFVAADGQGGVPVQHVQEQPAVGGQCGRVEPGGQGQRGQGADL
jgi:membrane protein DedA with SNARE-associated domain